MEPRVLAIVAASPDGTWSFTDHVDLDAGARVQVLEVAGGLVLVVGEPDDADRHRINALLETVDA